MPVSKLVNAELNRHDWSRLRCGCGMTAEHVPGLFRTIIEAAEAREAVGFSLEGHLEVDANLFEVSVPGVEVILAALTGELPKFARSALLQTLYTIAVAGESHATEVGLGRTRLGDECRLKARAGIWTVLRAGFEDDAEVAAEILAAIEPDESRLVYYAEVLAGRAAKRRTK